MIWPPIRVLALRNSGSRPMHGGHLKKNMAGTLKKLQIHDQYVWCGMIGKRTNHGAKKSTKTPALLALKSKRKDNPSLLTKPGQLFSPENIREIGPSESFHRVSLVCQPARSHKSQVTDSNVENNNQPTCQKSEVKKQIPMWKITHRAKVATSCSPGFP